MPSRHGRARPPEIDPGVHHRRRGPGRCRRRASTPATAWEIAITRSARAQKPAAAEGEVHPPGDDEGHRRPARAAREGEGVGVVGVEAARRPARSSARMRQSARGSRPARQARLAHPHPVGASAARELAAAPVTTTCSDAEPGELAREQPDLALPAAPFASRGDVDDVGSLGGLDDRPCAAEAGCPGRLASSARSSARLNGLCR